MVRTANSRTEFPSSWSNYRNQILLLKTLPAHIVYFQTTAAKIRYFQALEIMIFFVTVVIKPRLSADSWKESQPRPVQSKETYPQLKQICLRLLLRKFSAWTSRSKSSSKSDWKVLLVIGSVLGL